MCKLKIKKTNNFGNIPNGGYCIFIGAFNEEYHYFYSNFNLRESDAVNYFWHHHNIDILWFTICKK